MITFKLALRNIFRHKTRSIITLSAIAFGCVSLIFVGGFFEDVFNKTRESYIKAHTGHLQIYKKGFFENGSAEPFNYLISESDGIIALVRTVAGVKFVTGRIEFSGLLSTGENTVSFVGQGINPEYEFAWRLSEIAQREKNKRNPELSGSVIESGDRLDKQDSYAIILGRGLAKGIEAKIGDGLILVTHTTSGSINALDVILKGTFVTSSKAFDDHFLRLPLATAQKLLHTAAVQSLVVMLDRTEDTERIKRELARLFEKKGLNLELKTWEELSDFYTKTKILFSQFFLVLKIVIALIVVLSIFNTMNMAVLERVNEIGTIMALGSRRRDVLRLFLFEGLGLGIAGGILGIILGAAITSLISYVGIPMPPPPGTTITWVSEPMLVPSVLIFAFILSLITSLVSSLYPAYKASRLEIAEALRHV